MPLRYTTDLCSPLLNVPRQSCHSSTLQSVNVPNASSLACHAVPLTPLHSSTRTASPAHPRRASPTAPRKDLPRLPCLYPPGCAYPSDPRHSCHYLPRRIPPFVPSIRLSTTAVPCLSYSHRCFTFHSCHSLPGLTAPHFASTHQSAPAVPPRSMPCRETPKPTNPAKQAAQFPAPPMVVTQQQECLRPS